MAITPLDAAQLVFNESLNSLMAHTIRGVTNLFRVREKIELTVLVSADLRGLINLMAPNKGATSLLMTNFIKGCDGAMGRLMAKIYIHPHANNHLARVCIAHEIYHLLYEHDLFKEGGSQEWPTGVKTTKLIEDQCNQFAYQLCKLHDEFNKRPDMRKQHIHFPDHTFDKTFNMNNTAWYLDWPAEIMLDSKNPFHKRKAMPQQEKNPPL